MKRRLLLASILLLLVFSHALSADIIGKYDVMFSPSEMTKKQELIHSNLPLGISLHGFEQDTFQIFLSRINKDLFSINNYYL